MNNQNQPKTWSIDAIQEKKTNLELLLRHSKMLRVPILVFIVYSILLLIIIIIIICQNRVLSASEKLSQAPLLLLWANEGD
jgi:hypothetical protein